MTERRALALMICLAFPAFATAQAGTQGGWVPAINPEFVSQIGASPATGTFGVYPGIVLPAPALVPQPGVVILQVRPSPGSRIAAEADARARARGNALPIVTTPRYVYPASGVLLPYVFSTTYPILPSGIAAPSGAGAVTSGRIPGSTPHPSTRTGIGPGTPRTDVIRQLGRPNASVYRQSGQETLIFSGMTVIIENGVVAVIQ
jgi:hypothetical protein